MKNDTTCSLVQDLLPGYIDGVINEKSSEFVQKHLRQCEECRRAHDAMNTKISPAELHAQELVQGMLREKRQMRRLFTLIFALVLLITAVCVLPLPRKIEVTHKALEWRGDDKEYAVARTVTISGVYSDYLFRTDHFDGTFTVEGYPQTNYSMLRCTFMTNGFGSLWYCDKYGKPDKVWGSMMMTPNGKEFLVLITEPDGWNGSDGLTVSGAAETREEAVAIANKLGKKYSPTWLAGWTFE